jgi:hypothetical protein
VPISYSIDPAQRLVVSTATGILRFEEVIAHQQQLAADKNFDPQFDQLIDTTALTVFDVSADQARSIAGRRLFSHSSRRAFVASTLAMYGIGRMMEAYQESTVQAPQTNVFRDAEQALAWIREGRSNPTE